MNGELHFVVYLHILDQINERMMEHIKTFFDVLLTAHLSIILAIDQLDAQILVL